MRATFGRVAVCIAACLLAACAWQDDDATAARQEAYRAAVAAVMARYRAPGVVAGVWVPGEPPWRMAFGVADVASRRPLGLDDHFPIRSITKSFTVTALLQLVRDGRLSLDDPIDRYVPGVPNGGAVTLAQLAAMESGVADYSGSPAFLTVFTADFAHVFSPSELVAYGVALSPRFDPGARYEYSNTNTVLLGLVVERVTQAPLADVLRARILDPLKLAQTTYPSMVALPGPHPTPYDADGVTGATEALPDISPTSLAGSGAMVSTIDDLGAWGRALGSGSLLTPELQALRLAHSRSATTGPTYERYGLGIGTIKGWWGHTGSGVGFQAAAFHDPQTGATIAVLANATPSASLRSRSDNIAEDVFAALADAVNGR